jgi:hypothetical protein
MSGNTSDSHPPNQLTLAAQGPPGADDLRRPAEFPHPPLQSYLTTTGIAVGIYLLVMAFIAVKYDPITAAKVICITIFSALALVAFAVTILRKRILLELITLEELGFLLQEETLVNARQARKKLEALQERLDITAHPVEAAIMPELVKHVGPLIGMLVKKETGTLNWLMFGAKVAKNAFDAWKQRK